MVRELCNERDFDLIIAGAGPAGAALAYKMASTGARTLLLEKADFPGQTRPWVVDVEESCFSRGNIPPPEKDSLWKKASRHFLSTSDLTTMTEIGESPLISIKNDSYIREIVSRAKRRGVKLLCGREAISPLIHKDSVVGVEVVDSNGNKEKILAKIVADCTGISAAIRSQTPDHWKMNESIELKDIVYAKRETRRIQKDLDAEEVPCLPYAPGVRIDRSGVRGAYSIESVFIDIEESFIDILVGVKADRGGRSACSELIENIIQKMPYVGEVIYGGEAPIPIRNPIECPVGNGILSLGDSAFQAVPMHGSGFASAVIAAEIASRSIIQAIESKRYTRQVLWKYASEFNRGRGAILTYYDVLRKNVESMNAYEIDKMIRSRIISEEETLTGLSVRPFPASPLYIAKKIVRGGALFRPLLRFGIAGGLARMAYRKYRKYPDSYNHEAFEKWKKSFPV